ARAPLAGAAPPLRARARLRLRRLPDPHVLAAAPAGAGRRAAPRDGVDRGAARAGVAHGERPRAARRAPLRARVRALRGHAAARRVALPEAVGEPVPVVATKVSPTALG